MRRRQIERVFQLGVYQHWQQHQEQADARTGRLLAIPLPGAFQQQRAGDEDDNDTRQRRQAALNPPEQDFIVRVPGDFNTSRQGIVCRRKCAKLYSKPP